MIVPCAGVVLVIAAAAVATAPETRQSAPAPPQSLEARVAERDRALEQAAAALRAGRRDEAKQVLASAAERFDSVNALLQLARLQSGEGDAAGAVSTLGRARALAPNAEEVLGAIAQVSLAARAPVPAIIALEALTRVFPTVAQHHYLLGIGRSRPPTCTQPVRSRRRPRTRPPTSLRVWSG
ncbi:MAG: hypothetical protein LC804_23720 [Acidobacteria bacterium]|nr:hypothetical protein [Acidobacteriota bacterium]